MAKRRHDLLNQTLPAVPRRQDIRIHAQKGLMRALTQTERRERQDALADHALALFSESGYAKLTIEAIARRAGVAKGSVFLAFASKEDLFLHAVGRRFEAWFGRLAALNPLSGQTRKVAAKILLTLRNDPLLLPLLGLVDPVLEQGCSPAGVLAFKEAMAKGLDKLTKIWATQAPSVPAKKRGQVFMQSMRSPWGPGR